MLWDTAAVMTEALTDRLKRLIIERGTNPRALSVAAGMNQSAVRDILDGRSRRPLHTTIAALAKILGVSPDYLTGEMTERDEMVRKSDVAQSAHRRVRTRESATDITAFRRIREEKNLTQTQLAATVGCSRSQINRIETGKVWPSRTTLIAIADALDCGIWQLMPDAPNITAEDVLFLRVLSEMNDRQREVVAQMIRAFLSR